MKTFIKWMFGIFLFQTMGATGQEVDPKVKVLLPPAEPQTSAKNGNNAPTNAKIESSKGNRTLPPGLNTTQMVAEQYRVSGGLKPYNPSTVNNAQGKPGNEGVSSLAGTQSSPNQGSQQKPSTIPAGNKNLKSSQMNMAGGNTGALKSQGRQSLQAPVYGSLQKIPSSGYEQPGSPLGSGSAKSLNVKAGNIANQYESATSPLNGSNQGRLPTGSTANQKTMNSANPAGNVYDKVPGLINYNPAPAQPANQYGSLQLKPEGQNNTFGPPPNARGQNNAYGPPPNALRGSNSYGTLPLAPAQGAGSNTYGPPPNAGGQNNAYGPPPNALRGSNSYGTLPLAPAQGAGNNTYGPPPNAGSNSNTYGPPPNALRGSNSYGTLPLPPAQGAGNNTYGPPPNTGSNSNTYGPPPNALRGSNSYGTLPLAPAQGAGNNTYGPPPNAGINSNTYGPPPNALRGSNSYGTLPLAPAQGAGNNTYGPPPNAGGQNNTYGAPPRTGNQSANTYGPPPNAGGQNNTYGAPPRTGNQSANTYGPPPNAGGQNNTYGAPPRTGNQSSNTYGPPPQTGANAGPTQAYGPLPPLSTSGTQQVQANHSGGYSSAPPPQSGGQSSGSAAKAKSPGANPKELKKTGKGGAINAPPKSGGPGKQ